MQTTEIAPGLTIKGITLPLNLSHFKLIAFDMDSTLINIECVDEIADAVGRKAQVAAITEAAMRGEITDYKESLRQRVALLKGVTLADMEQLYQERLQLNPGASELVAACKQAGLKVLLVSGGFTFFSDRVRDRLGQPVAGAEVDIWQSSPAGLYENQDPAQADMNLRGVFTTRDDGGFSFRSVLPAGYPVPLTGPTGALLAAQKRHNWRPAHVHFMIHKPGFKTIASQVYVADDPHLETDSQFGVTHALIGNFVRHENELAPAADVTGPWYSLEFDFTLEPGTAARPRAPITGKAA